MRLKSQLDRILKGDNMIFPEEIADITKEVKYSLSRSKTSSSRLSHDRNIAEALSISCEFLSRLSNDDIFLEYERAIDRGNKEALHINRDLKGGAIELVSMDFQHFEGFLKQEFRLLKQSGFDLEIADYVVHEIKSSIDKIRNNQASGLLLEGAIARLRRYICAQSDKMEDLLQKQRPRNALFLGFGGVGLISINIAASGFLSPIGIGASAGIGGALVTDSVKKISDEFWKRI